MKIGRSDHSGFGDTIIVVGQQQNPDATYSLSGYELLDWLNAQSQQAGMTLMAQLSPGEFDFTPMLQNNDPGEIEQAWTDENGQEQEATAVVDYEV